MIASRFVLSHRICVFILTEFGWTGIDGWMWALLSEDDDPETERYTRMVRRKEEHHDVRKF